MRLLPEHDLDRRRLPAALVAARRLPGLEHDQQGLGQIERLGALECLDHGPNGRLADHHVARDGMHAGATGLRGRR
jgi:hypothetical protein